MFRAGVALSMFLAFAATVARQITDQDRAQIRDLTTSFVADVQKGVSPAQYLPPDLGASERDRQLKTFSERFLTFDLVPDFAQMEVKDATHVRVPTTVAWTRQNSKVTRFTQIDVVRVGNRWYFQNFDFVPFPWGLTWTLLAAGFLGGLLIWGFWVHVHRRNWRSARSRLLWTVLIFTPIGWILYPILKPWQGSSPTMEASAR